MALRDTIHQLNSLLASITKDLTKVTNGNKTAAKRVRTGTVQLVKVAKLFRKESMVAEKGGQLKKKRPVKKLVSKK